MLNDKQIELLAELHKRGVLSPAAVVEAARSTRSPLHALFEWDDRVAAEERRLDQARGVIRSVEYQFTIQKVVVSAPRYVHNPDAGNGQGYSDLSEIKSNPSKAWAVTRRELNASLGALKRARSIALALADDGAVSRALGRVIEDLEHLRSAGDKRIEGAEGAA